MQSDVKKWPQLFPMDRQPSMEELDRYADNPLWPELRQYLKDTYGAEPRMDYSRCGLEPGWNVKFKKSGRALCTIYPKESYFTVMVAVGRKEKEAVEVLLPDSSEKIQEIYHQTQEWNGQRWLMIDLEDPDDCCEDVFRLIKIRSGKKS